MNIDFYWKFHGCYNPTENQLDDHLQQIGRHDSLPGSSCSTAMSCSWVDGWCKKWRAGTHQMFKACEGNQTMPMIPWIYQCSDAFLVDKTGSILNCISWMLRHGIVITFTVESSSVFHVFAKDLPWLGSACFPPKIPWHSSLNIHSFICTRHVLLQLQRFSNCRHPSRCFSFRKSCFSCSFGLELRIPWRSSVWPHWFVLMKSDGWSVLPLVVLEGVPLSQWWSPASNGVFIGTAPAVVFPGKIKLW